MKHLSTIFCICLLSIFLSSCSAKESAKQDLQDFVTELQNNSTNYSENDWQAAGQKFEKINTRIEKYRSEYTEDEIAEIMRLETKAIGYFAKGSIKSLPGLLKQCLNGSKGVAQGLGELLEEEMKNGELRDSIANMAGAVQELMESDEAKNAINALQGLAKSLSEIDPTDQE